MLKSPSGSKGGCFWGVVLVAVGICQANGGCAVPSGHSSAPGSETLDAARDASPSPSGDDAARFPKPTDASAGPPPEAAPAVEPETLPLCYAEPPTGVSVETLEVGGRERTFRFFVPLAAKNGKPLPLFLNLHGSFGNATDQARMSAMEELGQQQGALVASLQADGPKWNIPVLPDRADDVAYARAVLQRIESVACVDAEHIFATGFSGGARMSSLLACALSDRLAGVAPVAGVRWPDGCAPSRPVKVIAVHGLDDDVNFWEGGAARGDSRQGEWSESVMAALAGWASHLGCGPEPTESAVVGTDNVTRLEYPHCRDGGRVVLYRYQRLGHNWPGPLSGLAATPAIWQELN